MEIENKKKMLEYEGEVEEKKNKNDIIEKSLDNKFKEEIKGIHHNLEENLNNIKNQKELNLMEIKLNKEINNIKLQNLRQQMMRFKQQQQTAQMNQQLYNGNQ